MLLVVWDKIWDEIWNDLYFLGLLWWKLSEEGGASLHLGISGDDRWSVCEVLSAAESCGGPSNSPFFWFWIIKKVLHACSHMLTQKKEGHGMSQSGSSSATLRMSTQFHSSLGRGGIGRRTDWAPANSTSRNTTRDEYNGAQHTACHRKKKHPAEMVKPRTLAPSTFQQVFGGSYFDLVPLGASDSNSFSLSRFGTKMNPYWGSKEDNGSIFLVIFWYKMIEVVLLWPCLNESKNPSLTGLLNRCSRPRPLGSVVVPSMDLPFTKSRCLEPTRGWFPRFFFTGNRRKTQRSSNQEMRHHGNIMEKNHGTVVRYQFKIFFGMTFGARLPVIMAMAATGIPEPRTRDFYLPASHGHEDHQEGNSWHVLPHLPSGNLT